MRVANLVLGLVVVMIGAVALADASDLDMFGEQGEPGPGFLPYLVAGLLVVLGLLLTAVTLARGRAPAAQAEPTAAHGGEADAGGGAADARPGSVDLRSGPVDAQDGPVDGEPEFEPAGLLRAGRVWIGLLLSVPAMTLLGFVPAMVLLMAYLIFAVERMTGVGPVLATILVPAATYAIFAFLLGVDLPASTLFGRS